MPTRSKSRVLAATDVNVSAAALVSGLSRVDKHGKRLRRCWKQFAQQLLPCAVIFLNGFIVGRSALQQPGETVTDGLWRRAPRYGVPLLWRFRRSPFRQPHCWQLET